MRQFVVWREHGGKVGKEMLTDALGFLGTVLFVIALAVIIQLLG